MKSHTTNQSNSRSVRPLPSLCSYLRERERAKSRRDGVDQASEETKSRIEELKQRLLAAKSERSRRIEYDSLSKVIGKLPDRGKGIEYASFISLFSPCLSKKKAREADE